MAALLRSPEEVDRVVVEPMAIGDVIEVGQVDRRCFSQSWPVAAYRQELRHPERSYYTVLRIHRSAEQEKDSVTSSQLLAAKVRPRLTLLPFAKRFGEAFPERTLAGFAGMWAVYDEAHVTTIGVDPVWQGSGFGELLLITLFDEAIRRSTNRVTLEVRISNTVAQRLYRKYQFTDMGVREAYYTDNREDALMMSSPSLHNSEYRLTLSKLRDELRHRLSEIAMVPELAPIPQLSPTPDDGPRS